MLVYRRLARNTRCNTMSHLTADAGLSHVSRETPDETSCHTSPPQGVHMNMCSQRPPLSLSTPSAAHRDSGRSTCAWHSCLQCCFGRPRVFSRGWLDFFSGHWRQRDGAREHHRIEHRVRGNRLSNTTCLTQVFFKRGESYGNT